MFKNNRVAKTLMSALVMGTMLVVLAACGSDDGGGSKACTMSGTITNLAPAWPNDSDYGIIVSPTNNTSDPEAKMFLGLGTWPGNTSSVSYSIDVSGVAPGTYHIFVNYLDLNWTPTPNTVTVDCGTTADFTINVT